MSFCQNCGKEIQEDWIRCPFCDTTDSPEGMRFSKNLSYVLGLTIMAVSIFASFHIGFIDEWDITGILVAFALIGLPFSFGLAIFLNAKMK